MNMSQAVDLMAPLGICAVLCAGVWFLGVWRKKTILKILAVAWAVLMFGGVAATLAGHFFGWGQSDYMTTTPGPSRGETSVVQEFPFFVNQPSAAQRVELTPVARTGSEAVGEVEIGMKVTDPGGNVLAEERKVLGNIGGTSWTPMLKDFQATAKGQYQLRLEIPAPVGEVKVRVTELPL
jgi:hypothetical protein